MWFLEHAGVATRNVVNTHATTCALGPSRAKDQHIAQCTVHQSRHLGWPGTAQARHEIHFRPGSSFLRRDKRFGPGSVPRPEAIAAPDPSRNGTFSFGCIPQSLQSLAQPSRSSDFWLCEELAHTIMSTERWNCHRLLAVEHSWRNFRCAVRAKCQVLIGAETSAASSRATIATVSPWHCNCRAISYAITPPAHIPPSR